MVDKGALTMVDNTPAPYQDIYSEIKEVLWLSHNQAYSAVNFAVSLLDT